jgi:hypothetical protein
VPGLSRGVTLIPQPLLLPWSRKGKSRAIPLLTYGPYGLYRTSVSVQGCTLHLYDCKWDPITLTNNVLYTPAFKFL